MKDYTGSSKLPTPTKTIPGTIAKQIILQQRANKGLSLNHPQDTVFTNEINETVRERISQLREDFPCEKESVLYKKAIEELSLFLCEGEVTLEEYEAFLSDIS